MPRTSSASSSGSSPIPRRSSWSSRSSTTRRSRTNHVAEATIWTKGPTLRARESASSYEASIDQLVDKLERQVKRYREKRSRRETGRRANGKAPTEEAPDFTAEQLERMIVKSKQFDLQALTPDEATLQLELVATTSSSSST